MKNHPCLAILIVTLLLPSLIRASSAPSASDIIARSVQAIEHDWEAEPKYDCTERDRTGKGSKTYEDLMIDGSPYQKLVAIDGKPLSAAQQAGEKQKLEDTVSKRKSESPEERSQRIAKYDAQNKRNHALAADLTKALDFKFAGEGRLDGHDVYVLDAKPRPGYQPQSTQTQVLTGMRGKLWIDKKTFQWVKVEAEVIHPVAIDGFLARVEPGTRFELEKTPVSEDVWLPKHFSMKSHARILFIFGKSGSDNESYSAYHLQKRQF